MDYKPKTSAAERAQLLTRQRALDYDAFNLMRMVLMDLDRAEFLLTKSPQDLKSMILDILREKGPSSWRKLASYASNREVDRGTDLLAAINALIKEGAIEHVGEKWAIKRPSGVEGLGLGPKGPTPMCAECGAAEATEGGLLCDACRLKSDP